MKDRSGQIDGAETARRAGHLLEIVASASGALSLQQIVEQSGLTKSTSYRLIRALQDEGWVERTSREGYRVGARLIGLASMVNPPDDIVERTRPVLESLARITSETATLHIRNGSYAILAGGAESQKHVLRRAAYIGERTPLTRGCAGLVILGNLDAGERAQVLRSLGGTKGSSSVDNTDLARRLTEVKRRGVALSFGENHPGVSGIAAPVRAGSSGRVVASISVAGPDQRWNEVTMQRFAPRLRRACADLSATLSIAP